MELREGKRELGGRGKHEAWQLEERRDTTSHTEHGSAFPSMPRALHSCPVGMGLLRDEPSAA